VTIAAAFITLFIIKSLQQLIAYFILTQHMDNFLAKQYVPFFYFEKTAGPFGLFLMNFSFQS